MYYTFFYFEGIASSSSEGLSSISEAKTCSFIVIGSNPGEPKKIFKDEKSDDNVITLHIRYLIYYNNWLKFLKIIKVLKLIGIGDL